MTSPELQMTMRAQSKRSAQQRNFRQIVHQLSTGFLVCVDTSRQHHWLSTQVRQMLNELQSPLNAAASRQGRKVIVNHQYFFIKL